MKKRRFLLIVLPIVLFAILVTGCGSSGDAELIGSYPSQADYDTSVDSMPSNTIVVYHAQVDLEVNSLPDAIDETQSLAGRYGGYTTYIYLWTQDDTEHATVIVSVPSVNYDALHDRVLRLGSLQEETIIGEISSNSHRGSSQIEMSTITVHMTEKGWVTRSTGGGWRPLNTFLDAFDVAAVIFQFLIDALIWVAVVAGPFVLIFWGIKHLSKRWQISIQKKDQEKSD